MFKCVDVSLQIGKAHLLNNINFEFARNKITAILGANGAGKSSLLKVLLHQHKASRGEVLFDEIVLADQSLSTLAKARAYVAQKQFINLNLKVFEYLLLARQHINEDMDMATDLVSASAHEYGITKLLNHELTAVSGGELQLIEFTRAYLQLADLSQTASNTLNNKCLLLDEPASALDIKQTQHLYTYIQRFKNLGGTVILVDHDINAMAAIADDIVMMKGGEVMASGEVKQVFTQSAINQCFDIQGQLLLPNTTHSASHAIFHPQITQ